ncbi:MerR family transcriptional regulator [Sinomonas sp. B1-1]|uniref:MerR family transcriptional regulator n=1 Tax=Sinomonas sp. B1-1 TaxID=3141454 RepID=UPI003D2A2C02
MRISQAARAAGTTQKALRYYESIGLLREVARTTSGYRDYTAQAVGRATFVRRSRDAGLTLDRTAQILAAFDAGRDACAAVEDELSRELADLDRRIAELTALRAVVAARREAVRAADPAVCDRGQVCSFL